MSLSKCYRVFECCSVVYWLAVPWLLLVWVLQGCESVMPFDPVFDAYVVDYEGRLKR
jgi:hypothetical protein